jgi:hypothetical protein
MTKDGMTQEEKARLDGIRVVLDLDICASFECPYDGCDECPIRCVIEAQENLQSTMHRVIGNYWEKGEHENVAY